MTSACSILVAYGGQSELQYRPAKDHCAESCCHRNSICRPWATRLKLASFQGHGSSQGMPYDHDRKATYLTVYTLLGMLCITVPSDDGACYSKAFCSFPSPPYLRHPQFSDHGAGSRCHCTHVVGMPYSCRRFHLLSNQIELAADDSKTLCE